MTLKQFTVTVKLTNTHLAARAGILEPWLRCMNIQVDGCMLSRLPICWPRTSRRPSAGVRGAPASLPRRYTSFRRVKSEDEKFSDTLRQVSCSHLRRQLAVRCSRRKPHVLESLGCGGRTG